MKVETDNILATPIKKKWYPSRFDTLVFAPLKKIIKEIKVRNMLLMILVAAASVGVLVYFWLEVI